MPARSLDTKEPLPNESAAGIVEEGGQAPVATEKTAAPDGNVVSFAADDPEHPRNWSTPRKWIIIILIFFISLIDNLSTAMITPAAPQVLEDFGVSNDFYLTFLVSIWELGEGIGPFIAAPLSERYGRLPVLHCGNILFILCGVGGALSTNISMLAAFRFFNGFVTTSGVLGPSVVGDLFPKEKRGTAMAIAIAIPMTGPFVSPVAGSYLAAAAGWRWTVWLNVIAGSAFAIPLFFFFRETYQVKILERRVNKLKAATGDRTLRSQFQDTMDKDTKLQALTRPFMMLLFAPTVAIIASMAALTYGISFVILTDLASIMESIYGFSEQSVGLTFLGRAIGNLIGIVTYMVCSDRYLKYRTAKRGSSRPEDRLLLMLVGAALLPAGLILCGWTLEKHVHYIAPIIGTAIAGFSLLLNVLPTQDYLVDVYELHGASAVAVSLVLRQFSGGLLPLAGPALYHRIGSGWGNTLLALLVVVFIPGILLLQRFGGKMCNKERFA